VSRIGVAVIGYGLAGSVFHAPLVAANPDLEVRAIVTANPERRRRAGRDFPEARLLTTPDQLWNDTSGIGLVVVATPTTSTHLRRSPPWVWGSPRWWTSQWR